MGITISLPHPAGEGTVAFILLGNIEIWGGRTEYVSIFMKVLKRKQDLKEH